MKKKILGALVALSMVCSLLPTIAFAETGFYVETSGGTENYSTLTNAWDKAMAADEATITMYEDATISSQLQVLAGDNITLDLNGHTIDRGLSSSSAVNGGSVIYVMGDTTTNEEGCFTLTDTSSNVISEQGTITGGNNLYSGGGINVCEWGRFTMEGGNITGNKSADNGGGVTVSGDTDYRESYFTMTGGSISGNTASDNGGGIAVFERGFVEIEGGTISGNTATTSGGGVYLYGDDDGNHGTLTMSGDATITGNSANLNGGGVYVTTHSEFIMTGGTIGGDDDSYANTATYGGGVSSDSGTFKMNDGTIIGNAASRQGGGVYVNDEYGYFEMNNGTITKNSSDLGSGIHVEIGYLKMTGGNISGNSARYGGGLDISDSDGYAEITDGNITGNSATDGGGVYVDYGEFKMTGGNISGNSADSLGGGVYLDSDEGSRDGIFTLTGGNITGNKATSGGGIYVRYYDPTKYTDTIFKVSDNPVITGNTLLDETTSNNVYLPSNKTITVDTSLTTGAKIGVTTETEPTDTAPVAVTGENTADYTQYFTSDLSAYSVSLADSGNVVQLVPTADSITISLEETTTTGVYDIVLTAPSGTQIDKFLSAQLKFVLNSNQTDSTACDITKIDALTVTANTDDYIGLINYGSGVYEFNMDGTNASSLTGSEITLGTVTINGLGYYSLGLDTSYDNVINCDSGSGVRVEFSETEGNLTLSTVMPVENEIKPELVPLTINVKFPNRVYSQTAAYTDMAVEVNNNIDERYLADETIALGSNGSSTKTGTTVTYVTPNTPDYDYYGYVIETEVAAGYSATLTFTGSGYRTCSATVLPESGVAAATVNVWNNPMDNSIPVVYYDGTADTSSKTDIIFLAGDIENDKSINLYDLSAVTSFFGYEAKDLTSKPTNTYLGKDLNRDGKIDSRDIALVLVAWGK